MKVFLSVFIFAFTFNLVSAQKQADDVLGLWLTDDGRAKIEIYNENGKYSGKIVWLIQPQDVNGNPPLDTQNPDPEMRKNQY